MNNVAMNKLVNSEMNNVAMNKLVNSEESNHPAHMTLSDSIQLGDKDRDLEKIQNNMISGVDPDVPSQAFSNSLDLQGLNYVKGFNSSNCCSSKFW